MSALRLILCYLASALGCWMLYEGVTHTSSELGGVGPACTVTLAEAWLLLFSLPACVETRRRVSARSLPK